MAKRQDNKEQKPKEKKKKIYKKLVSGTTHQRQGEQTKKNLLVMLEKHKGIVSFACRELGIARQTHYKHYYTDPVYRAAVDELKNVVLDFAEGNLYKAVERGDTRATIFILSTIGRDRGYVQKQEIEHSGDVGIHINMNWIEPEEDGSDVKPTE